MKYEIGETVTCKCGHCYFSIQEAKTAPVPEKDLLLLHCISCGTTTIVKPYYEDGLCLEVIKGD